MKLQQRLTLPPSIQIPNSYFHWLISVTFGILLYILILVIGLPEPLNQFFQEKQDLTTFTIIVFLGLYIAYSLPRWIGISTSCITTLALFASQLSQQWHGLETSGYANGYTLGGIIPANDTNTYYTSALRLLYGDTFNSIGSLRPLSHGVITTLLKLTQENLPFTVAILTLITAISCFLLAEEIQKNQGTIASVIVLTILFLFIKPFIGSVATENLGLAVGAVGIALLWRGISKESIKYCLFGLFLLTLALNIRAGAFFILPALIMWGTVTFRRKSRFSRSFLIGGLGVVLLGFIINSLIFKLVAYPGTQSNGNFAYVLYGMLVGGDWTSITKDHPNVWDSKEMYKLSLDIFLQDPLTLVRGFLRAWNQFFLKGASFSFVRSYSINSLLQVLSLSSLVGCLLQWRSLKSSFLLMGLLGVFLSLPFAPPWDGGTRIYAATIPFFALFPAVGLTWILEKLKLSTLAKSPPRKQSPKILMIVGVGLTALIVFGIVITKFVSHPPQFSELSCPADQEIAYFANHAGASLNILSDNELSKSYVPNVKISDFRTVIKNSPQNQRNDQWAYKEFFNYLYNLPENTTLISQINLKNHEGIWVITDSHLIPQEQGIIRACGTIQSLPWDSWYHGKLFFVDSIKLVSK